MKVILFAGAEIKQYDFCKKYLENADVILCCDSGIRHTRVLGIVPDYILGDFDSCQKEDLEYYKNMGITIKTFPTQKDETDMELGLDFAVKLGADNIVIFGGIGSRFDHTLANAHLLLKLLKKGIKAMIVDEKNCVELIDKDIVLEGEKGELVSTIPLSMKVTGITLEGFAYPLTDHTLTIDDDIVAVSNVMMQNQCRISIKTGYLFVIRSKD